MHRINQEQQRASRPSANRYNTDTYIIQYKQSKEKINNPKEILTVPVSPFELLNVKNYKKGRQKQSIINQREKFSQKNVDHRKNIDRLMEVLKSNSKSQDKGNSAIHKIVRIIDKIYQRYWRIYERIMKRKGFEAIHKISVKSAHFSQPFFLKDSLEFQQNQIQRFSKNFQLQDLIQIVDLHVKQNQQANQIQENSLDRELNNQDNIHKNITKSPRRISQNIYIMKKGTKQQLQTRPQLSNFTTQNHIKSILNIREETNKAYAITPRKINGRTLQKNISLGEKSLKLKQKNQVINQIPLQQRSIDSFVKERPSQTQAQYGEIQHQLSKIKMPIFGEKYIQKRTNRLMNPQNKGRKIIFHYKNSHQKIQNPIDNYYVGIKAKEDNRAKHQNQLGDTRMETNSTNPTLPFLNQEPRHQFELQQVRIQRSTSMQVLSPKVGYQQEPKPSKIQNQQLEDAFNSTKKRCFSMPKITFTYMMKEDSAAHKQAISQNCQKTSPIFITNELRAINHKNENNVIKQDSYLQKSIEMANIYGHNNEINKVIKYISPQRLCNQASIPKMLENNYKIPVQSYIVKRPENSHYILQKVDHYKQDSKQQRIADKCVCDENLMKEQIQKNEYYKCRISNKINSVQALQSRQLGQNAQRSRVRSSDAYILAKRITTKPTNIPQQNRQEIISSLQRNRTKSCGIKLQIISKIPRLIQAY